MKTILGWAIPGWAIWLLIAAVALALYGFGRWDGERIVGLEFAEYKGQEATRSLKVLQGRTRILERLVTEYLPAKAKVITRTETIIQKVPVYVTQADNDKCTISNGFVRVHDAAWSDVDAAPAVESDREPAGVSLAEVAETQAFNAGACFQWREQALALRKAYNLVREEGGK